MKRFQDQNLTLQDFEDEILIVCPKCSQKAMVSSEPAGPVAIRKIKCLNCFYTQTGRKETYAISLDCHCPDCSAQISVHINDSPEPRGHMTIRCIHCGSSRDYQTKISKNLWPVVYSGQAVDPFFQLPLWLAENVKGKTLWAYNHRHLEYLKNYIAAELREKNGRSHFSLLEKLPDWIKSAKNRQSVLKGIEKLEKK